MKLNHIKNKDQQICFGLKFIKFSGIQDSCGQLIPGPGTEHLLDGATIP